ncbi:MAG: 4Fe-4S binding protein [Peptococcaceae bacterium]|nr:4Fe-4S binding protein [Peptococcaceae bacterium]
MFKEQREKRRRLQALTWAGLPLVVIGGWFYPPLGFLLFGCMLGAVGVAFYRGRAWCDWMCPRGSFFDLVLARISPQKRIPSFLRGRAFRSLLLVTIFLVLSTQLYFAWGDLNRMGLAMVRVLTITTSLGIILALLYHPRTWCHICPMGTLGNWISGGKQPLTISNSCVSCKICAKACPMQLMPYEYLSEGVMGDRDCIKCSSCVASCPKKALSFPAGEKNEKPGFRAA